MPRHKFHPTEEDRQKVKSLAGWRVKDIHIASILGLTSITMLRKHFSRELAIGPAEAITNVLKRLFDRATSGEDPPATIFWLKTRAGWSEKGNRPESITRTEDRSWVIREYQPPRHPGYQNELEEAVRRREAANRTAWPEWEGDKGDPQEDQP
ncbi:MAG: hypothetical protein ACJ74Z_01390 [Bryobacteraceae bacterium]|jgi:hypothetical protein